MDTTAPAQYGAPLNANTNDTTGTPAPVIAEAFDTTKTQAEIGRASSPENSDGGDVLSFVAIALITGLCAAFLVFIHAISPRMHAIKNFNHGMVKSIASGMTMAYLFLQSIPALLDNRDLIIKSSTSKLLSVPHQTTFLVFLMVLLGATVLYTLEKVGTEHSRRKEQGGIIAYGAHLVILGFINFGVAYCMPTFMQDNFISLIVYIFIMGLYFVLEDYTVHHCFPEQAKKNYAFIMGVSLLLGWAASLLMISYTPLLSNTLIYGFVVGGMLIVAANAEFSAIFEEKSHYPSFLISVIFQAMVALLLMLFANIN